MKIVLSLFLCLLILPQKANKINFGSKAINNWQVINDGVMGGQSDGKLFHSENSAIFRGTVSLKNNGGFSSFKSPIQGLDLSVFTAVEIRYKSTGIEFAMTIEDDRRFFQPYLKRHLKSSEEWTTVQLKMKSFKQFQLGKKIGVKANPEMLAKTIRLGFISDEKQEGSFEFEVDYIKFIE